LHSKFVFPLTITLEPVPVLTLGGPLNNLPNNHPDPFELTFINKHIIFAAINTGLTPFLRLQDGGVVGLYGKFVNGRIVLTGPDNNFHGDPDLNTNDLDLRDATKNHYDLLFN
ncbi:MAG: hypothetical protein O6948_07900, partial [Deltaproteobacteria bacterium]|nr:hypothetical protein [Deltaproteobacteria bacterium]